VLTSVGYEGLEVEEIESSPEQVGNRPGAPSHPQPEHCTSMPMEDKKPVSEFDKALKAILRVSKDDLKRMLRQEKLANAGKPKRGPKPRRKVA
jgi:hypothetical protein